MCTTTWKLQQFQVPLSVFRQWSAVVIADGDAYCNGDVVMISRDVTEKHGALRIEFADMEVIRNARVTRILIVNEHNVAVQERTVDAVVCKGDLLKTNASISY